MYLDSETARNPPLFICGDRYGQILKRNNMRNLLLSLITFSLLVTGCKNLSSNKEASVIQSEELYFDLGGVQQYIEILKSSDNNPVLLFVHGGPAWPQTPQFRYFNKEIANKFTVVIWEQRGAGKSYLKNKTPGNISLNQIIDDGQELVKIIKDKFNVEKIYLAGYSWGSIVGLKMVEEESCRLLCLYWDCSGDKSKKRYGNIKSMA